MIGSETGKLDELSRQVQNFDRLAHIQGEDFAPTAQGGALQHQADSFRDGHEIAHHIRMSHGDRPTGGNLFAENRNDAAGGPEHVAEPDRHKAGSTRLAGVERLHAHFRQSLGRTHNTGWVDGFIARDEDEPVRSVF